MPVTVPTVDEVASALQDLQAQIDDLAARVSALEDAQHQPPDPDGQPDPPPAGTMQVVIAINGKQCFFDEIEGVDLGDYHDPDGRFTVSCKRATHPDMVDYRVDFRRLTTTAGAQPHNGWACVVCDYGNALIASEPTNLPAHLVTVIDDAGVSHHYDLPAHYWAARWRWQSGEWPHMRSVEQLVARAWIPRLDATVNRGTAGHLPIPQYEPMGLAGLTADMSNTGGRADIGFVTDWQGEWLCTGSDEMLQGILAQGEAGGTIPWHHRDPATGALLDLMNTYKQASCYWTDSTSPYVYPAKNTGIEIDTAHTPAVAYLPFVLTGDPYFLETLQAQANQTFLQDPRSWEWVWQMPGYGQTRAMAWSLRTIAQAAAVTPDEVPGWLLPKSVMQQMLNQCKLGTDCIMSEGGTNRTALNAIDVGLPGFDTWNQWGLYPASCYSHPWQTSFFCQSAAYAATLHPELRPLAGYIARNIIARTKGEVWDSSFPADYCLLLKPAYDAPWFANWDECWAANAPLLGAEVAPLKNELTSFGDYHGGVYAGLCALAHARAAGVTEIPVEIDATLEHYAGQMDALLDQHGDNFLAWNNSYQREQPI